MAEAARVAMLVKAPVIEALLTADLLTPENIEKLWRTDRANYRRARALQRERELLTPGEIAALRADSIASALRLQKKYPRGRIIGIDTPRLRPKTSQG